MAYAIVDSVLVEMYCETKGRSGRAIEFFLNLRDAVIRAEAIANEYQYGVEVVCLETYEIQ